MNSRNGYQSAFLGNIYYCRYFQVLASLMPRASNPKYEKKGMSVSDGQGRAKKENASQCTPLKGIVASLSNSV